MTTSNFDSWLDALEEPETETMANLYESIVGVTQMGMFTTKENGGRLFVKADDGEETLMIASEAAKKAFLEILDVRYGDEPGMGVVMSAELRRANGKND